MQNKQNISTHEKKGHIVLRDHLAAHRTDLANDRTFLAYIRTALTLVVVGVTFIRFFGIPLIEIIGWIFIPTGIFIFFIGLLRFNKTKKAIREEELHPPKISDI